jgi:peptidoglycan L-alanyl-D-glutamate endopeptidase CwlK
MAKFSKSSEDRLAGVHPDLVKVMRRAIEITGVDFRVIEGVRTLARQKQLLAKGASQTLRSRHIPGGPLNVSHAVDIAPVVGGVVRWDWPLFHRLAPAVKQAAIDVGVPIEWGGDWRSFPDGPHFQLPWKQYPA